MQVFKYIVGTVSVILIIAGVIIKKFGIIGVGWEGQKALVLTGMGLFVAGFTFTLVKTLTGQSRKSLRRSTIILFIAIECSILAIATGRFHLTGRIEFEMLALILFGIYWVFFSGVSEGRKLQLRKDRQLAAILFTDIVGFTAMMGEEEDKALKVIDKNRQIQKQVIRKHRGKYLKEMGDGSLVIFYTATDAVAAAYEIQNNIQKKGEFKVRMGIHISEILFTDTDVFGDGVNVASRISDEASANEICISDAVFQNIRNREDLDVTPMGQITLKNVAYPLNIYKIEIPLLKSS
jgi:class 3 adenylate cyclase